MPQPIWSRPGNPPRGIATRLGITRHQLRDAIHAIKHEAKLGPRSRVTIWDDGTVTDEADVWIGNIHNEI
jgi:hypothetical protein